MTNEEEKEIIRQHYSKLGSAKGDCKRRDNINKDFYKEIRKKRKNYPKKNPDQYTK